MTVASQTSRVSYAGNGSTVLFAVPFYFLENGHLRVVLRSSAGVETVQTITTNYTVTGAGNPSGGSITMVVAPPSGSTLVIVRNVPVTQETDYQANDPFPAESHERALDKLTMIAQQSDDVGNRAIKIPETETNNTTVPVSGTRANKLLGFNLAGDVTLSSKTITAIDAAVDTIETIAASPSGSSAAISHIAAGSGAVSTTVQAKLREIVSVKDFGAVGDGITDDTAAIQAAIDANEGGIYFPPGTYLIGSTINFPIRSVYATNQSWVTGQNAVIQAGFNGPLFAGSLSPYQRTSNVIIEGLHFKGFSGSSDICFSPTLIRFRVSNCKFSGFGYVIYGANSGTEYLQSVYLTNNIFDTCQYVVLAVRAYDFKFENNMVENCVQGVFINGNVDPAVNSGVIANNVMEGGGVQIQLGPVFSTIISGNYFEANTVGSPSPTCDIDLDIAGMVASHRGLVIMNNQFQPTTAQKADSNYYNIRLNTAINNTSASPTVFGNATSGTRLITGATRLVSTWANFPSLDAYYAFAPSIVNSKLNAGANLNRSVAYSAGVWQIAKFTNIARNTVIDCNGFLSLENSGLNLMGQTFISFKLVVTQDYNGLESATVYNQIVQEISGDATASRTLYASYWGAGVTITATISGSEVIIEMDNFNDYSYPVLGTVQALRPSIAYSYSSYSSANNYYRVDLSDIT